MGKQQNQVPQIHIVLGKLDLLAPYVARSFGSKCEYISNGSFAYAACVPENATALEKACRIVTRMISHSTILF